MRSGALLLVSCDALLLVCNCAVLYLDGVARLLYRCGALLLLAGATLILIPSAALFFVGGDGLMLCVALLAGDVVVTLVGNVAALDRGQQSPSQAESRHQGGKSFHLSGLAKNDNCDYT